MEYLVNPTDPGITPQCIIDVCFTDVCGFDCTYIENPPCDDSGEPEPCSSYDCGGYEYSLRK